MELSGNGLDITPSDNREMRDALHNDPQFIKRTRIDAMYGLTNLMDEALAKAENLRVPTLVQYGKKDQIIVSRLCNHLVAEAFSYRLAEVPP
jgi:acylglycerol lipase